MKDIFAVLSHKEAELKRLQAEIDKLQGEVDTLRSAALMLSEESESATPITSAAGARETAPQREVRVAAGGLKHFP